MDPLWQGLRNAFVDSSLPSLPSWTPDFVYNDAQAGQKVFCTLEKELRTCNSFWFSVAFITNSGVQLLKPILRELSLRDVRGKIITTDYLCFSDPEALDFLDSFENIELRMMMTHGQDGFHTKGYLFFRDDSIRMLIGSSNLTASALLHNAEWNSNLISGRDGAFCQKVIEQFEKIDQCLDCVPYSQVRENYTTRFRITRQQRQIAQAEDIFTDVPSTLTPNTMQARFISNLHAMTEDGQTRALLISATGTGKTYAAAFAVRDFSPRRMLFLVHREQIARQAMNSFRRVVGSSKTYGLLGGGHHELNKDYIFSTVQTLSRDDVLDKLDSKEFDLIVIDEVHRAAASSYQKIFNHFRPELWLGMSATPQRTDHTSIYDLFDHNVACEIGLRQALEEDLLCPFHYYALSDLKVDDETIDDPAQFNRLIDSQRVEHIMEEAEYYGSSGKRTKGLMFVSSVKEAKALSEQFNQRGWKTLALSGDDSQQARDKAIARLVQDEQDGNELDYLITVDIFNEGVDIPEVTQVIMLRPTKSAIVFVQQLGRGLRKTSEKEYVNVLDFIGNYNNSYLIPTALSESKSGSKDALRRFVSEGNRTLPGLSTVYFDEIARNRIFQSIQQNNMNSAARLKDGLLELREKLGRVPDLVDFELYHAMDPLLIFSNNRYPSYPEFLNAMLKKEYALELSETELQFLRFVSSYWANGKRPHELLMLKALMDHPDHWLDELKTLLRDHEEKLPEATLINLLAQFSRHWLVGTGANSNPDAIFIEKAPMDKDNRGWKISHDFEKVLKNDLVRHHLNDLIEFGLMRYENEYKHAPKDGYLCLNKTYSYEDSFRLMDFPVSEVATNVGGYKHNTATNQFPVYINYDKAEDIVESIAYEDHFTSPETLIAFSKSKRSLASPDMITLQNFRNSGLQIPLFVRKNTKEQLKEFYYLGRMKPTGQFDETTLRDGKTKVVRIGYALDHAVRDDLYDFFTEVDILR